MNKNATGLFEGDNLLNQIVNISKAAAYDVTVENVKALQAQNAELIKQLAAMYKIKVLVVVKDGMVETISSNSENTRIVVIDHDNRERGNNGFISEPYEPDAVFENLYEGFTDETDPVEVEIRDELKRMKF